MGWFSNPKCPRCGRETTIGTDGLINFYECRYCIRENRKKAKEKEKQERRIKDLEKRISELEEKLN